MSSRDAVKMLIHSAEDGHTYELECEASTCVETIQHEVASFARVPLHEQLLICGDTKLESRRTLGFYKLPNNASDVFLFNKSRLVFDCPPPDPEQIEFDEIPLPPFPLPSQNPHPLDEVSDPALKALPSYERQFKYHLQRGRAIYVASQARFETCNRLLREQQVQESALDCARHNMDYYYKMIDQMYGEFTRHFYRQHKYHSDLLLNFERDTQRLRSLKLHPALASETRTFLVDLVRGDNLQKWAETCASSHRQFEAKVSQLKIMYSRMKTKVEDLFDSRRSINVRHVEDMITEHALYLEEQANIVQSLSKDVNTVKKLVDDCVSSQLSALLQPHDAVSALGPMYDVHDKSQLPKMEACSQVLAKLLDYCKAKKHEMSVCVHTCMQQVASLQSSIRDVRNQLSAFKEAMGRQDEIFADLKFVRRIGLSYRACLAEVVRRKAWMKLYMEQSGQLAENMAGKREAEVALREEFLKVHGIYVPQDILGAMGLFDIPSQCVVSILPFDTNLLDIDVVDLEHYAPESLVRQLSKGDQSMQGTSSSSLSNSSQNSGELEDVSVNNMEYNYPEIIDEGCNGGEISGATKMEVENAWLKAELASTIAMLCSLNPDIYCDLLDDSKLECVAKGVARKTVEALHLKDAYAKHLHKTLKMKQMQWLLYEKQIQELEQRLSGQYMQLQKQSHERDGLKACDLGVLAIKADGGRLETSVVIGDGRVQMASIAPESMDEATYVSSALEGRHMGSSKTSQLTRQDGKFQEGVDVTMTDFSGSTPLEATSSGPTALDASMRQFCREDMQPKGKDNLESGESGPTLKAMATSNFMIHDLAMSSELSGSNLTRRAEGPTVSTSEQKEYDLLKLQNLLVEKTCQCNIVEVRLKAALDEVASFRRELEVSSKLLDESQMNCAHLENRLHEAREEAQTNLCAADRRSAEYNVLRASNVKLRGMLEILKSCIAAPVGGATGFSESLRALAVSLGRSSVNDNGDDGIAEFQASIRVLAEKMGYLAQQHVELFERCARAEAAQEYLSKELEGKTELLKSLYAKHKTEKQVFRERISFSQFEVHQLAAFVPNSAGQYEAINRNCPNYFLSDESIALFLEHLPHGQRYIIGQIVHIEKNVARLPPQTASLSPQSGNVRESVAASNLASSSLRSHFNPYGLRVGTEYFVVTVAMVPSTLPLPHS